MTRFRSAALAAVLIGASFSSTAFAAGEISEDALKADRESCQNACIRKNASQDACTNYCDCTIKGVSDQFSLDEYRALADAADKKQPVPEPALSKIKSITNSCRAHMTE